MPFTASHPAAVLPLVRLGLPASALAVGSLAPDLPYYLPTPFTAAQTHRPTGILTADLVLGLGMLLAWHLLLEPPLRWAAPAGLQRRLGPARPWRRPPGPAAQARSVAGVLVALALGTLTHLTWDAFTHADQPGPRLIPWLCATTLGLPHHRWLQMASSVVGLAVLAVAALWWWGRTPPRHPATTPPAAVRWGLPAVVLAWASVATGHALLTSITAPGRASRQGLLIESLLTFVSTATAVLVAAALAWHGARALGRRPGPARGAGPCGWAGARRWWPRGLGGWSAGGRYLPARRASPPSVRSSIQLPRDTAHELSPGTPPPAASSRASAHA